MSPLLWMARAKAVASGFDPKFAGHLIRNHQQHCFVLSALWELRFGKDSTDWIKTFSGIELSPILTLEVDVR